MKARLTSAAKVLGAVLLGLLCVGAGYALSRTAMVEHIAGSSLATVEVQKSEQLDGTTYGSAGAVPGAPATSPQRLGSAGTGTAPQASSPDAGSPAAQSPTAKRYVVRTASMAVEVKNLDVSIAAIRALVSATGSEISNLQMAAGSSPAPTPVPLDASGRPAHSEPTPSSAHVTLRVPADQLPAVEAAAAKLGTVLSQTASQDDVTQQHIDLAARLKNLQAEEAQLRTFYRKARNVDDLLSVQEQLSSVQGDIESMQAQLAYLDRQAALATLTLALSEPGAIVRPAGTGWGFSAAITTGVQTAAALVRAMISATIALSPVLLAALVLWALWQIVRRRRGRGAPLGGASSRDVDAPLPAE